MLLLPPLDDRSYLQLPNISMKRRETWVEKRKNDERKDRVYEIMAGKENLKERNI